MRRFLVTIEYIGTNYNGFQLQKNKALKTVEDELNKALKQVFLCDIKVIASGRLDAGVHSKNLKAHFDVESSIKVEKVANAINHFLPEDISIIEAVEVSLNFHARYSVKQKTYEYTMYVSEHRHAILDIFAKQLYVMPDVLLMQKASEYLLGTHDFSSFMNKNSSIKSTTRTIKRINFEQKDNVITMSICGNGFLYNMVRIIMGTLLNVGYGKTKPEEIKTILEKKDRKYAGKMVEAKGLSLTLVEY